MSTLTERVHGETLAWLGLVLTTEFLLVVGYVLVFGVTVRDWTLFAVPFVWINVGGWAILRTVPTSASDRDRRLAKLLAAGYFLVLAYFGGLVAFEGAPITTFSVNVVGIPPGWSPAVIYSGDAVNVVLLPYKVIGYLALAYLVYATALDASNALAGGLVGIFSCVSCSFPVIAGVVTGIAGGGGALAAATTEWTYLLSTLVFVVTVALLYWRPSLGSLRLSGSQPSG
jgi:hypothetical protein